MKILAASLLVWFPLNHAVYSQTIQNFPAGISLGTGPDSIFYSSIAGGNRPAVILESLQGGLTFYSPYAETTPGYLDGGIQLLGKPVSVVLGADNEQDYSVGTFDIWRHGDYWMGGTNQPVFRVDTAANRARFDSLDVIISGGSLTVGGGQALTTASCEGILGGLGFLQSSSLVSALNGIPAAPSSSIWTNTFIVKGNTTPPSGQLTGGLLALGSSTASGERSISSGYTAVASGTLSMAFGTEIAATGHAAIAAGQMSTASGQFSVAVGNTLTSSGAYSFARGNQCSASGAYSASSGYISNASGAYSDASGYSATATGFWSTSRGMGVTAKTANEIVLGRYNIESTTVSPIVWLV